MKHLFYLVIVHLLSITYVFFIHGNSDVLELHQWHVEKCSDHPLFALVACSSESSTSLTASAAGKEEEEDICIKLMQEETEEGKKVARLGGRKHFAVFRRLDEGEISQRQFAGAAMRLSDLCDMPGQGPIIS